MRTIFLRIQENSLRRKEKQFVILHDHRVPATTIFHNPLGISLSVSNGTLLFSLSENSLRCCPARHYRVFAVLLLAFSVRMILLHFPTFSHWVSTGNPLIDLLHLSDKDEVFDQVMVALGAAQRSGKVSCLYCRKDFPADYKSMRYCLFCLV